MPMYEYQCAKCGHDFEHLAKSMTQTETVACPACGSQRTQRQLSVFAVGAAASKPARRAPCAGCTGQGCGLDQAD